MHLNWETRCAEGFQAGASCKNSSSDQRMEEESTAVLRTRRTFFIRVGHLREVRNRTSYQKREASISGYDGRKREEVAAVLLKRGGAAVLKKKKKLSMMLI
ncbi:hypothetical protein KP509_06G001700 [Ceratopteris richardii]|uniref:Uncharacterized protein n=1 Tax=Ceratopteris richardii TaxID=49495 RepID=A0A8T2UJU9_CERRI|nr:hypothetical protein KP509_06G001700 [Ceratopteris richardii]